jgi:hypothetical protein
MQLLGALSRLKPAGDVHSKAIPNSILLDSAGSMASLASSAAVIGWREPKGNQR